MYQQDFKKFEINVFRETPEGYLTGKLCVTGAGVFRYLGDERKFVGRLRSVEQVKDATASLNCKPVTLQHPNTPVNLENVSDLSVGMSANDAEFDGLNNFVTVTVTDKKAINAIKNGEVKAISCGYKCNVVDNSGVWQGSKHEQEQRDIVYNHIALVKEGRAGDQVRFCVGDSAEAEEYFDIVLEEDESKAGDSAKETEIKDSNNNKQQEQSMKTIQLDGVDYQADEKVIETLLAAQNDAAEKLGEIHTLLDGVSELEAKVADLEEQLAQANDEIDESVIDAAVNAKIAIMDAARAAGIECSAEDDVSDLKRQVIKAAFDSIDLDSVEDESAINAIYSSAVSVINGKVENDEKDDRKNPTVQFDGRKSKENNAEDSMEDVLMKNLRDISNGKEVK
ncbi:MAG: DUF2213 domain-containing protein [Fibrobacter sp.]|nr:DUF2213 domain-containing protein [Fibrobacter sp.]